MPNLHTHRPHHLALAIAFALSGVDVAIAQQLSINAEPHQIETPVDSFARLQAFIKATDTTPTKITKAYKKGPDGIALQLNDANDLVIVLNRGSFNGAVDGGGGQNVLQLDAKNGGTLDESRNFAVLHAKQGDWILTGTKDFKESTLVDKGSTLTNNGGIAGGAETRGTLINNGWIGGSASVLRDGHLSNIGDIKGHVVVDEGATFGGKGNVGSLDVHGRFVVDRSQGAAQINGDLKLFEGAELSYEINADGSAETITVDGTATLENASLTVNAMDGEYPLTQRYTVLEANKVEGEFGKVSSNLAYMTPTLAYTDTRVGLIYARNDVPLETFATTENSRALANSLEPEQQSAPVTAAPHGETPPTPATADIAPALLPSPPDEHQPSPAPVLNTAINALLTSNTATAAIALEQLAGVSTANLANATLSSVRPVSASMLSTLRELSNDASLQDRSATGHDTNGRVWVQALGNSATLDDKQGESAFRQRTHGVVVGADWSLDNEWRAGVLGGKSQTRLDGVLLDGDLDSWHLGAYALRQSGPLALRLGATYSSHDGTTKRNIAFNGYSDRLKGSYDASSQQVFAEVGYNLSSSALQVEPFASLGYERYQRDSYREKGGDAALKVDKQTQRNFSSIFGLRLAHHSDLENGMRLTPRMSAGWKRTYGNVSSHVRQTFLAGSETFYVEGIPLDRNSLTLEAGLDLRISKQHSLSIAYNGEMSSNSHENGVMGQWRMNF